MPQTLSTLTFAEYVLYYCMILTGILVFLPDLQESLYEYYLAKYYIYAVLFALPFVLLLKKIITHNSKLGTKPVIATDKIDDDGKDNSNCWSFPDKSLHIDY